MPVETGILPERYREPALVARGGMGEVYRATDATLGRIVAVKLLDSHVAADGTVRDRFTREALAAARLSDEAGTVTIFDVGEWNDRPYIVMEYLDGGSLEDVLRHEGAQPPGRVFAWLEQTAHALDNAHERGVVHRDVKPGNLLLDSQQRVHVADFGVATAAGLATLTQTGTVIGTAGYLSPEQAQGRGSTPASDRYGLAVVAFELLAGRRPFENASTTAEATAHVNTPVPAISRRAPGIPAQADAVFAHALAKDPAKRFSSCGEFVAALRHAFDESAGATRVLVPAGARRRSLLLPAAAAALLAGGVGAAALLATRGDDSATPPSVARVTVTQQGTTVLRTVTARQPTAPTSAQSGSSLAAQGYARLQAGDVAGALPLLQQAAQQLQGSGSLTEAYNDYNLAYALARAQGCSTQVLQLLDASESIQGHRKEIDKLRKSCRS